MKGTVNCYQDAYNHLLNFNGAYAFVGDWKLCHGVATLAMGPNKGREYGHAWIETDTVVFDQDIVIIKSVYYRIGKIRNVRRFKLKEALEFSLREKHFGPWDNPAIDKAEEWITEE